MRTVSRIITLIVSMFGLLSGSDRAYAQPEVRDQIFQQLSRNALEIPEFRSAEEDDEAFRIRIMCWGSSAEYYFERLVEQRRTPWIRLAKEGNKAACFLIGRCYTLGLGFSEDQAKAQNYLIKSADQGHVWAMVYLAKSYLTQGDKETALSWYRKAAETGDAFAQQVYFKALMQGVGGAKDVKEATKWIEKAIAGNNPLALCTYAELFLLAPAEGFEKSPEKCVQLLRIAAENGSAVAMNNLGGLYEEGIGVEQSVEAAVQWYKKAVALNHTEAMNNLGLMLESGTGVSQNLSEAVRLYKLAAQCGEPAAMVNLGACYRFGKGVEQQTGIALSWTSRAADKGNSVGLYQYGVLLLNGIDGVEPKNEDKAFRMLQKSFEVNPNNAGLIQLLVHCYENGIGTDVNHVEAARLRRLIGR